MTKEQKFEPGWLARDVALAEKQQALLDELGGIGGLVAEIERLRDEIDCYRLFQLMNGPDAADQAGIWKMMAMDFAKKFDDAEAKLAARPSPSEFQNVGYAITKQHAPSGLIDREAVDDMILRFSRDTKQRSIALVVDKGPYDVTVPTFDAQQFAAALLSSAGAGEPVAGDTDVLNGIRDALEKRGYIHMANGADIGAILDEKSAALDPATIEACAKVAEDISAQAEKLINENDVDPVHFGTISNTADDIAAAIRALAAPETKTE